MRVFWVALAVLVVAAVVAGVMMLAPASGEGVVPEAMEPVEPPDLTPGIPESSIDAQAPIDAEDLPPAPPPSALDGTDDDATPDATPDATSDIADDLPGEALAILEETGVLDDAVDSAEVDPATGSGAAEPADEPSGEREADAEAASTTVTVQGSGTREDPYVVPWDLLASAQKTYRPRAGLEEIPEAVMRLDGAWVQVTGYVAFPLMVTQADEIMVMYNQWDGCCIGVPPTPYDGIEVRLASPVRGESGVNIFNYGTVRGRFRVDPYLVNNWLVGLYLMEDATLKLEV